jgi:hypothetical protein
MVAVRCELVVLWTMNVFCDVPAGTVNDIGVTSVVGAPLIVKLTTVIGCTDPLVLWNVSTIR